MASNFDKYLKQRYKPENVNIKHRDALEFQDKIALFTTKIIGTMYAVYIFIVFIAGWMLWQTFFANRPFDPFPFAFLLFLGNIVQLLLMPLIMVGQNLQGRHAEIRTEEEYRTTISIYRDIEQILLHLSEQDKQTEKQFALLLDLSKELRAKLNTDTKK
jgi:uncharacterized membrane protein